MLLECNCFVRECKHYEGVKRLEAALEESEVHYCLAFPDGIPESISLEDNKHLTPIENQGNELVFQKLEK